ncbi:hypothetical protein OH76DRAFT_1483599 [Lentinus brumalis]|uniref:Uncharacterized protein n=1 Tax=Lentinus brumalis TaxID=2498619 RepID=A0A371D8D9_9APHY|nr:hypothetical protein OH76DRAFT_1483599 [Polyporus brumalis]
MPKDASPKKQTNLDKWMPLGRPAGKAPKTQQRDSFGWESRIPEGITLGKKLIREQYGLMASQLNGVARKEVIVYGNKGHVYYERAVEWRAWETYGGPVGLWHRQDLQRHINQHGDTSDFLPPYDYRSGELYDVFLDDPPRLPDRYCHESPTLVHCKSQLTAWVWDECNKVLDDALSQTKFSLSLSGERETAMLRAVDFVLAYPEYAARPASPLEMTSRVHAVAATLNCAVSPPPDSCDWVTASEVGSYTLEARAHGFDWSEEYLEELFAAVLDAMQEHAAEPDFWKSLRWLLYDKYVGLFARGLRYSREFKTWSDGAREWLEGKMHGDALHASLRTTCKSGMKYNELLPDSPIAAPP